MTDDTPKKKCFVIGPIGQDGSDTRNKADYLLELIIKPAVEKHGYIAFRADEVPEPGLISDQVIIDTYESDLVIADLTSHNANAFYELGIRHAISNKPTIHMILEAEDPPFDVKDHRYISYRLDNPSDLSSAKKKLSEVVGSLGSNPQIQNPVTKAIGVRKLKLSEDSRDRIVALQNEKIDRLEREINQLRRSFINRIAVDDYIPQHTSALDSALRGSRDKYGRIPFGSAIGSLDERIAKELGYSDSPTDVSNPGGLLNGRKKPKE
ncbi:MAG: hypothetical protein ABW096_09495 [Candidatus Thiodiazotropha sp.]